MTRYALPRIELAGAPRGMGRAQGESLRESIRGFIAGRRAALADYAARRGRPDISRFVELGARCRALAERWDRDGAAELLGIAEGADVDPDELYAIANLTDVRDLLLLSDAAADEGCSALLLPPDRSQDGEIVAAQTWDLNPSDLEFIVAVHRRPDAGPETWSLTLVGATTLIGMNEHGLAVGTTNIKTRGARVGVGYMSLMHRAVRSSTRQEARQIYVEAPRAAAHTYWIADPTGALELECTPEVCIERELGSEPLARTNHCLSEPLRAVEGEPPTSSSLARLARLEALLAARPRHDVASLCALFADRADGVDSINRFAEDGQPTATNAVAILLPARRRIWACRGPADRGDWVELGFS